MNNEFKSLSYRIGTDVLLVQGAGGNTSFKDDSGIMWVKASGTWLSNSLKDDLFVPVDYNAVRKNMMTGAEDPVKNTVMEESPLRPSIETTLHVFMQQKIVLHVHMIDLIALALRTDGEQIIQKHLQSIEWAWVPYTRPGIDLTNLLLAIDKNWRGNVLVLGNHGLVVGGDDCAMVEKTLNIIQTACKQQVRSIELPPHAQLTEYAKILDMRLPLHEEIHALGTDPECFRRCQDGVLYPDQAVFLGPCLESIRKNEDPVKVANEHRNKTGTNADYFIIEGIGVLLARNAKDIFDEMLLCHVNILLRIEAAADLRVLSSEEVGSLLNWEPEKYRMLLDKASND